MHRATSLDGIVCQTLKLNLRIPEQTSQDQRLVRGEAAFVLASERGPMAESLETGKELYLNASAGLLRNEVRIHLRWLLRELQHAGDRGDDRIQKLGTRPCQPSLTEREAAPVNASVDPPTPGDRIAPSAQVFGDEIKLRRVQLRDRKVVQPLVLQIDLSYLVLQHVRYRRKTELSFAPAQPTEAARACAGNRYISSEEP